MDKMALIGPAYHEYKSELGEIIKKYGKVWSCWTYYHPPEKEKMLRSQLARDGFFYIYVLDTKEPSIARRRRGATRGSGMVDYKLKVRKIDYEHRKRPSPDPNLSIDGVSCEREEKSCGWYLVEEINLCENTYGSCQSTNLLFLRFLERFLILERLLPLIRVI